MSEIPKIITADSPLPKEIDDGIFVNKLDCRYEVYEVGVCIADTSSLYENPDIRAMARERQAAQYDLLVEGDSDSYEPMVPIDDIKTLELTAGGLKNALITTFNVGPLVAPHDLNVRFGQVEVTDNMTYLEFAEFTSVGKEQRYRRAGESIKHWLNYRAYGDHVGTKPNRPGEDEGPGGRRWKRGSKTNEAYMVGINHLIGQMLGDELWPAAIYRVHDPRNSEMADLLSASAAYFSNEPGLHAGLNVAPYCRMSSPLRRFDDFVNTFMLKKRYLGVKLTEADIKNTQEDVRLLNEGLIEASKLADKRRLAHRIAALGLDEIIVPDTEQELLTA